MTLRELRSFLVVGVIFLAISPGCGQLQTPGSAGESSKDFYPNTDGYRWDYKQTSSSTTEVTTISDLRTGSKKLSSGTNVDVSLETMTSTNRPSTMEYYERVLDSGVWFYGTGVATTEAELFLPFPLAVGNTWRTSGGTSFNVVTVITAKETVKVPAGTFDAYRVESGSSTYWYGKGAGLVKIAGSGPSAVTLELTGKNF